MKSAAERDQAHRASRQQAARRLGLRDGDSPTIELHLEDRVQAQLGREPPDLTASRLSTKDAMASRKKQSTTCWGRSNFSIARWGSSTASRAGSKSRIGASSG
jgi:hypothetical protein